MRGGITPVFVETVPEELEDGVLYLSIRYNTAAHLCACGCGMKVVTPLHPTAWEMHWDGRTVSLSPSIGNWQFPCRSHYFIRRNRIVKARGLAGWKIERDRERDRRKRSAWFRHRASQTGGEAQKAPLLGRAPVDEQGSAGSRSYPDHAAGGPEASRGGGRSGDAAAEPPVRGRRGDSVRDLMTRRKALDSLATHAENAPAVALSISRSPDMAAYGTSDLHLRDLMGHIAMHLLASGQSLAYSADLRADGFPDLLLQLLIRHQGHSHHCGKIAVTDYLAWPVHIRMTLEQLDEFCVGHGEAVRLTFLAQDGAKLTWEQRRAMPPREPGAGEWESGLSAMRATMCGETVARIAAGGRIEGYKGRMPGVAEEVLLSLEARQPVFLLGGFGGCARGIAETIGLVERKDRSPQGWAGSEKFSQYTPDDMHNGLSREDNAILADTPHIDVMVRLAWAGVQRSLKQAAAS